MENIRPFKHFAVALAMYVKHLSIRKEVANEHILYPIDADILLTVENFKGKLFSDN